AISLRWSASGTAVAPTDRANFSQLGGQVKFTFCLGRARAPGARRPWRPSRVTMATVVTLDRHGQLDLEAYRRIALEHEPVAVGAELLAEVDSERAAMLRHLDGGGTAYGVNTGLGYLMSHPVEAEDQAAFQRSILLGRAAGIGPPLSAAV